MILSLLAPLLMMSQAATSQPAPPYAAPGEEVVAPYEVKPDNPGATPFTGNGMALAFHGKEGVQRIVDRLAELSYEDKVIGEIFQGHDQARFKRILFQQFCYLLNAGCSYTGRDMASAHKNLGTQQGDMNRLVEVLQQAMTEEHVAFGAQNRFLSKLAPMRSHIVER